MLSLIYLEFMQEQEVKDNSPKTIEWYSTNLQEFFAWLCSDDIKSLNVESYKKYIIYLHNYTKHDGKKLASSSVNSKIRAVRAFYNFAIENDYIPDVSKKLKVPRVHNPEKEILEDFEIEKLMNSFADDNISLRNKCFAALMLDSGLRRGEPIKLRICDVDFKKSIMLINGKGSKQRFVPIGDVSKALLKLYKHEVRYNALPNEPFFVDRFGNPCSDNLIKLAFQDLKEVTGIKRLHPHLLRHTFATLYLIDGGDLETLRLILGHSSITVTQNYLHLAFNYQLMHSKHNSHLDKLFNK